MMVPSRKKLAKNYLNLALHHHPPEVVDGVGEGSLAGNVGIAATSS